ncbi:MAG: hypothetical protein ACMUIP_10805 [bacterium]
MNYEKEKSYCITVTLQQQTQILISSAILIEINGGYLRGGDMRDAPFMALYKTNLAIILLNTC